MLLLQPVLADGRKEWGGRKAARPRWLRTILSVNRAHARRHGHAVVVRWKPTLRFPCPWQDTECNSKEPERERVNCWLNLERENFNWEKHQMMLDYLRSSQNFTHVLVLDADAALVHETHDTLRQIAADLETAGKDIFFTNEDWIGDVSSKTRINGGFLFAKNTAFTRSLFEDLLDAHWYGPRNRQRPRIGGDVMLGCSSNEQLCISSIQRRPEFSSRIIMESGKIYNCGTNGITMKQLLRGDPKLEVMHFMGGAKSSADSAFCGARKNLLDADGVEYGCT